MGWTADDMPDQRGRTILITGANSGLGLCTAEALAAKGAEVLLACRNEDRARPALERVTAAATGPRPRTVSLDLADLASVRACATRVCDRVERLDVLMNNAGVMAVPHDVTADGDEMQFGTNHLGHFALTNLLLPRITRRVVTVSSNGHRMGRIDLEDLNWERRRYRALGAYTQSKLANLLFTAELQRRLTEVGSPVLATAAHPGVAATNLFRRRGERPRFEAIERRVVSLVTQSAEDGALPPLYAAVEDIPGNSYVGPSGFKQLRGDPTLVSRSRTARDAVLARRLWTVSEDHTGVSFPQPMPIRPSSTGLS